MKYIVVFMMLLCMQMIVAQQNKYIQLTSAQGLPNDNVYAAAQHFNGTMWFGTNFGIAKYDGYKFTNFDKKNGIVGKAIVDIETTDGDSLIFISYPNVLQSINNHGVVHTLANITIHSLQQIEKVGKNYFVYERNSSTFYIWNGVSLMPIDLNTALAKPNVKLWSITRKNDLECFISTSDGVYLYNTKAFEKIENDGNIRITLQRDNITYFITNKSIKKIQNGNPTTTPFNNEIMVYSAVVTKNGRLYYRGIDKGLYLFYNNKIENIAEKYKLNNSEINTVSETKDGNIWINTGGKGVFLIPKNNITYFNIENGLPNSKLTCLFASKEALFIGTENGICKIKDNKISKIDLPKLNVGLQFTSNINAVSNFDFGINISNTFSNLVAGNGSKMPFVNATYDRYKIFATNANVTLQDNDTIWLALSTGVIKLVKNVLVQNYTIDPRKYYLKKILCIKKYDNILWLGTANGFYKLRGNNFEHITTINQEKIGEVLDLIVDKKNRLWAATQNGVLLYQNEKWISKITSSNAAKNYVKSIEIDNIGDFWLATWGGISKWNEKTRIDYSVNNGLTSKTCNDLYYDNQKDQLYVATDNGLNIINIEDLNSDTTINSCSITCYNKNDNLVKQGHVFEPIYNEIKFYFNLPFYAAEQSVSYKYKINNGAWIETAIPSISFTDLRGGKYILSVIPIINGQEVTSRLVTFNFSIKIPFYKNWWFIITTILLSQFALFKIIARWQKKRKTDEDEKRRFNLQMADLKQQAFTSLLNPHFIFNSLNSIQSYINKQDRKNANQYLSDFAKLIRRNFDSSKLPWVQLEDEIETLKLYLNLEKMRFGEKVDYAITVADNVEIEEMVIPSLMLQPFLENAILHGISPLESGGKINISFVNINGDLQISIKDNGVGYRNSTLTNTNKKHNSRSMQLIIERIEMINKMSNDKMELIIQPVYPEQKHEGTSVLITMPFSIQSVLLQAGK